MRNNFAVRLLSAGASVLLGATLPVMAQVPQVQPAVARSNRTTELITRYSSVNEQIAATNDPVQLGFYHLQQADVLEQLVNVSHGQERADWMRRLADSLQVAGLSHSSSHKVALARLSRMKTYCEQVVPDAKMVAYVAYRHMQVTHESMPDKTLNDLRRKQNARLQQLAQYVENYPQGEDSPGAMMELAMTSEHENRIKAARAWYQQLSKAYPDHPMAKQATASARRLGLEGKQIHLALPRLADLNDPFDIDQVKDKVVVVYFWRSSDSRCASDFEKLKTIIARQKRNGVELVSVNLDNTPDEGQKMMQVNYVPGIHVHQRGGVTGPLVRRYGITEVPTLILVGKGSKVLHRKPTIATLEKELDRHTK